MSVRVVGVVTLLGAATLAAPPLACGQSGARATDDRSSGVVVIDSGAAPGTTLDYSTAKPLPLPSARDAEPRATGGIQPSERPSASPGSSGSSSSGTGRTNPQIVVPGLPPR